MDFDKWDIRFLRLADHIAEWSKDPSTKTGAVIVRPDRTIAATGFNGFPRGMSDDDDLYADRTIKYARTIHCEVNAVLCAHGSVNGYTLFTTTMCCDRCAVQMIQAGIRRFVWWRPTDDMYRRWHEAFKLTGDIFVEAGVDTAEYDPENWNIGT